MSPYGLTRRLHIDLRRVSSAG
ncbi:putative leader peptide [Actinomycetota bacterium Odt1-20B]